jgi:D-aminoacyl-tRNA deacylase
MGGISKKISIAPASKMKKALMVMAEQVKERDLNYDVSYECTHHGPSLDIPAMFAELGSTPTQWKDVDAAEIVAQSVIETLKDSTIYQTALGIGGPHYNRKFTKMALTTNVAFAHIIPKYVIPDVEETMVKQCLERVVEKVELAVMDWKGIKGEHKPRIFGILKRLNLMMEKV